MPSRKKALITRRAGGIPVPELKKIIQELEKQMLVAAENLEFETAAGLRDRIFELRELLALQTDMKPWEKINLLAGKDS